MLRLTDGQKFLKPLLLKRLMKNRCSDSNLKFVSYMVHENGVKKCFGGFPLIAYKPQQEYFDKLF